MTNTKYISKTVGHDVFLFYTTMFLNDNKTNQ